jgi:AAA+ superfamily predicted ATPase
MDKDLFGYTFSELVISYDSQILSTDYIGDDLILVSDQSLSMELRGIMKTDTAFRCERKILLELYRTDEEKPLCVCAKEPYDDELLWTIDAKMFRRPGKYYVKIHDAEPRGEKIQQRFEECKGAYRYTFFLLKDGERMEHPELKEVSLSSDLKLVLNWNQVQTELDRYDVVCYNDAWELMGKAEHLCFCSSRFKISLDSPLLWVDGAYFMVLVHNGKPFLCIDFDWKDGGARNFSSKVIDSFSPYSILAKDLRKDTCWQKWQAVPGASGLRKAVVMNSVHNAFNLMRMHYGLPECWKAGQHCALILEDGVYDKDLLYCFSNIINPLFTFEAKDCSVLLERRNENVPIHLIRDVMDDWNHSVLCLHHLSALMMAGGNLMLKAVEEHLQANGNSILMLVGTSSEIRQIMEASAVIGTLIQRKDMYRLQEYTLAEQVHWVQRFLKKKHFSLSTEAGKKLVKGLQERRDWKKEQLLGWLDKEVLPRFVRRVLLSEKKDDWYMKEMLAVIEASDIRFPEKENVADEFSVSMEELNKMVGLNDLKTRLAALFNRSRFESKRHALGLPVKDKGGCHMIFTGNPGTGKTTVARMVGRVFHSLGLLSKGGVVVTERSKLVGRYLGDTENNVQALLEQAKGNVLFIDEAYNLFTGSNDDRRDFGHRVIESLLTVLSQKNPDLIVILSGYEKEMMEMLETNPGMKGRFPYQFKFDDYTAEELMQIAQNLLKDSEYVMTPDAEKRLVEIVKDAVVHKDAFFHNARWIEQCIQEGVVSALADRVMNASHVADSRNLFCTIEAQDIDKGFQMMKPGTNKVVEVRRRIGFVS